MIRLKKIIGGLLIAFPFISGLVASVMVNGIKRTLIGIFVLAVAGVIMMIGGHLWFSEDSYSRQARKTWKIE